MQKYSLIASLAMWLNLIILFYRCDIFSVWDSRTEC